MKMSGRRAWHLVSAATHAANTAIRSQDRWYVSGDETDPT
jgi:hypothetical protein